MSYSITITFDTLPDLAAWFKSNGQNVGNGSVTSSAPHSTTTETLAAPESDPWTDAPSTGSSSAATNSVPDKPFCEHGLLKKVPAGVSGPNSKNPGTPYDAFWACNAPRGVTKCRLDPKRLPDID